MRKIKIWNEYEEEDSRKRNSFSYPCPAVTFSLLPRAATSFEMVDKEKCVKSRGNDYVYNAFHSSPPFSMFWPYEA